MKLNIVTNYARNSSLTIPPSFCQNIIYTVYSHVYKQHNINSYDFQSLGRTKRTRIQFLDQLKKSLSFVFKLHLMPNLIQKCILLHGKQGRQTLERHLCATVEDERNWSSDQAEREWQSLNYCNFQDSSFIVKCFVLQSKYLLLLNPKWIYYPAGCKACSVLIMCPDLF